MTGAGRRLAPPSLVAARTGGGPACARWRLRCERQRGAADGRAGACRARACGCTCPSSRSWRPCATRSFRAVACHTHSRPFPRTPGGSAPYPKNPAPAAARQAAPHSPGPAAALRWLALHHAWGTSCGYLLCGSSEASSFSVHGLPGGPDQTGVLCKTAQQQSHACVHVFPPLWHTGCMCGARTGQAGAVPCVWVVIWPRPAL
jgi:hypothetical protein